MHLAVLSSHPIQYNAPIFRKIAEKVDIDVFFAHKATPADQANAGFGVSFEWDVDLTSGYRHFFLRNVAKNPNLVSFSGCDTPDIGLQLSRGNYDSLLILGWNLKCYLQGLFAAKRLGIPVLVRGDSQLNTPKSLLKRVVKEVAYPPFLRSFDAACYVGAQSRAYYEHYRFPSKRLFFSPHCVDNDWFCQRATDEARNRVRTRCGIPDKTPVLLFAGKLIPRKRPHDVIAAASECRSRGVKVEIMIAGSGELEPQIRDQARELGVPTHMLGFCNQSQMPEAYAASDMLILPSEWETWGLVVNEALACGKPFIISETCACAPELASDGIAGRIAPCANVKALANAIIELLSHPPSALNILAKSASFSVEKAVEGILTATEFLQTKRGLKVS